MFIDQLKIVNGWYVSFKNWLSGITSVRENISSLIPNSVKEWFSKKFSGNKDESESESTSGFSFPIALPKVNTEGWLKWIKSLWPFGGSSSNSDETQKNTAWLRWIGIRDKNLEDYVPYGEGVPGNKPKSESEFSGDGTHTVNIDVLKNVIFEKLGLVPNITHNAFYAMIKGHEEEFAGKGSLTYSYIKLYEEVYEKNTTKMIDWAFRFGIFSNIRQMIPDYQDYFARLVRGKGKDKAVEDEILFEAPETPKDEISLDDLTDTGISRLIHRYFKSPEVKDHSKKLRRNKTEGVVPPVDPNGEQPIPPLPDSLKPGNNKEHFDPANKPLPPSPDPDGKNPWDVPKPPKDDWDPFGDGGLDFIPLFIRMVALIKIVHKIFPKLVDKIKKLDLHKTIYKQFISFRKTLFVFIGFGDNTNNSYFIDNNNFKKFL